MIQQENNIQIQNNKNGLKKIFMSFNNFKFNIFRKKFFKCLLITPPLLNPKCFYIATPILLGQLKANGYNGENLDLNIKFFRTILTKDFIEKIIKELDKNKIFYEKEKADLIKDKIENALTIYKQGTQTNEKEYKESEEIINSALTLISLNYKNFKLDKLNDFEYSFSDFQENYKYIKEKTTDKKTNIFIDIFKKIIKDEIKRNKYDLITITVPFIGNLIPALTIAKLLKEMTKSHITLGGNFIKPQDVLNNSGILDDYCDSILFGEGEESIVQLAKAIELKSDLKDINGIMYKDKNGKIISNEPKTIKNINDAAIMSLDGINLNEYLEEYPSLYFIISKGCYWGKCRFCSLAQKYNQYKIKSPKKVVRELKELKQNNPRLGWVQFQDDALHPLYLGKLADEIIKENLNINYFIFARFEKEFTMELLEKLYKSGLRSVYWGLESGCQTVLDKMNKGIELKNVLNILKNSYNIGISNMIGFIVNFPTETIEEYNKTIDFIKTILPYTAISPGQFSLMKNSYIYDNAKEYGLKIKNNLDFSYNVGFFDSNLSEAEKLKRWNNFCKIIKDSDYNIDENKNL